MPGLKLWMGIFNLVGMYRREKRTEVRRKDITQTFMAIAEDFGDGRMFTEREGKIVVKMVRERESSNCKANEGEIRKCIGSEVALK